MRKLLVVYEKNDEIYYKNISDMLSRKFTVETICIQDGYGKTYIDKFFDSNADYICSLDMAGFQINTLLDYPNYNMMTQKQIHIIIDENVFPLFGDKEFALNLFVYVPDHIDKWQAVYPHIPNLYSYKKLEADAVGVIMNCEYNQKILDKITNEVIQEAEP